MKIAPLITNLTKSPAHIRHAQPVSFKSTPQIFTEGMKELENIINNEITPFVNDSRDLYIETGKIGYRAQEAVNFITLKENKLYQHKFRLQNTLNNALSPEVSEDLELAKEYKNNLSDFESIEKMSNRPMYKNPDLKEKISAAKATVFAQDNELVKIRPISDYFDNNYEKLGRELEKIDLRSDENLFKKFEKTREQQISAQYFMFITPYNDAIKLKLKYQELKSSVENPAISAYTKLENIENALETARNISKDRKLFYENRKDIEKFVKENKNQLPPPAGEIKAAYEKLTQKCDEISEKYRKKAGDFVQEHAANPDFSRERAKKLLKKQKETNDSLYLIIDKIKTDYITAQNKEFYENWKL